MELNRDVIKVRVLLAGCFLLLVSGCYSLGELQYLIFAKSADASVIEVRQFDVRSRGGSTPKLGVEYSFRDGDAMRTEEDQVSADWPTPSGTVKVQFIPGSAGQSRLDGHSERHWVFVFLGILTVCGVILALIIREAQQPARSYRKRF